jgi:tetratricopeptide (TPR) repeat protein
MRALAFTLTFTFTFTFTLTLTPSVANAAPSGGVRPISLEVARCASLDTGELERLLSIELRAPVHAEPDSPKAGTELAIECTGRRALLRVRPRTGGAPSSRALDLETAQPGARPRLVALALAELAAETSAQRPRRSRHLDASAPAQKDDPMLDRILSTSLVASMLLSVNAIALPKKESEITASQTALTRPPPRAEATARPGFGADELLGRVGAQLHAVTDSQIKVMKRLLDNTADSDPDKAELHFQFGGLYAEQRRWFDFHARDLDGKTRDPRLAAQQADWERRARDATLLAVTEYLEVADHPERWHDYQRMDEVLFDLAYLLNQVKKEEAARGYFKRLIKDHPTSRFIPDALLAFGDHYFDQAGMENALVFYDKVLAYPASKLYGYALYKKGWCFYNLADFKQALATFLKVAELAGAKSDALGLAREARKDIVRAYAQVGSPDKAWALFQRAGGPHAPQMLEQLAELYLGEGKFADSVRLYRQLVQLFPQDARLCAWQGEVVKATLGSTGARAEPATVKELERLAALGDARPADRTCKEPLGAYLRELAPLWHKEAQTTGQRAYYELAHALYRLYAARFSDEPQALAMTFYDAELLYKLERHCEAAPLYGEVVRRDPSAKAKWLHEAAWAAVLSWRSCLGIEDVPRLTEGPPTGPDAFAPRPIPEPWRKMFLAFDNYARYLPDGAELPTVIYKKARALYELNRFDEAIPLFRELVDRWPQSELAVYAADLLFDCYAIGKRTRELEDAVEAYCPLPALERAPGFSRRCRVIRAALLRDRAESLEKAHRYREAAETYIQLAQKFPDDPRLDEVLYDAAIDFQRAKVIGLAILAFQELIARRPESPLAKKSLFMVGRNYQEIAELDKAAESYEAFATRWPGERDATLALQRAAFFRRGLGHHERALEDTQLFLRNYAARPEMVDTAAGVAFGASQIYEQRREWDKLERHLDGYLRSFGARGGIDREIVAHVKLAELAWRRACPIEGVQGACVELKPAPKKSGCGRGVQVIVLPRKPEGVAIARAHLRRALELYGNGAATPKVTGRDEGEQVARAQEMAFHAAEARMIEGDLEYERFLQLRIPDGIDFTTARGRHLVTAWLQKKSRALEVARRVYATVILLKQAHWAIAASARIGQLFQGFAAQLLTTPVPKAPRPPRGVDPREWAQLFRNSYCDAFGDEVTLLEDRAVDALGQCLKKSTDLSWFNEWSSLCEAELNQLRPVEYPLASELRAEPGYVAALADRVSVQPLNR